MICFSAMLMTSFRSFYIAVTVLPLFAWGSHRWNNSVISQSVDEERFNDLRIPLGPAAHSRFGREDSKKTIDSKRVFGKEEKSATLVPTEHLDNISAFLQYLYGEKEYEGKRKTDRKQQVLKCLQQPSDGITCFGNGKFYQFTGSLEGLTANRISEMAHESECMSVQKIESVKGEDSEIKKSAKQNRCRSENEAFRKLFKRKSPGDQNSVNKPYQEVLMESHGLAAGPRACYGFVNPQVVHRPKSSVNKVSPKKCQIKMCPCGGHGVGCGKRSRRRRKLTNGRKAHYIMKRSHMRTVACRPLYVPTPKPSVNEGRVAKCRLPCGAHNCLVVPTCPCAPPCKTQAPCPSTCPPCQAEICCTKPPDVPRCPPYEITEEPCPSVGCPARFPFLTTPHCPCSKETVSSSSSTTIKGPPCSSSTTCSPCTITRCPSVSPCPTSGPPCPSSSPCGDKPSCNSDNKAATVNMTSALRLSPSLASPIVNGTIKGELTGKKTRGNANSRAETLEVEPVKLRPRVMGLWPSFDFKKLLKSAKYQNKDKPEQDKVEPLPVVLAVK